MATQPEILESEPAEDAPLSIMEIVQTANVCDLLTESEIGNIGSKCLRDYEIDRLSRADWLKRYKKWLDVAMQVTKEKTWPWKNAANIHYPLLTTASLQFQARAYPAIVSGADVVKVRTLGPDPNGEKSARAIRVGQHMTWQLLQDMPGWEEDTDRMLLMLPIVGCVFRKSYYDEIQRTNMSVTVPAEQFVVNYWAKSLESTPRYTHCMPMYPYEVREKINAGIWRDVSMSPGQDEKSGDQGDDEALGEMLEQHCLIDLDGDGYPEPYIVTMNTQGHVACIAPCFSPEGVLLGPGGAVVRIKRNRYFTKYGFLPAPDGSFYDMGFGMLLEDISRAINTSVNQMFDAGTLANMGGGFIGSGINIRGGKIEVGPGRWNRVDVVGGTLRENVVPNMHQGPSTVLFNLLGMLIDAAKNITSVQDVLTGGESNYAEQPTTTLARIEQGMKVMTGIFKRIHRAFGEELKILFMLNGAHLDDIVYGNLNDVPFEVGRFDYQQEGLDVVPVSDPSMASDAQKMVRAQVLMERTGDPRFNQVEIAKRWLEAVGATDPEKLLTGDQPPDPKVLLEIEKRGDEHIKALAEVRAKDAQAAQALAQALRELKDAGLMNDTADMANAIVALAGKVLEEAENGATESADGSGEAGGMEGQPADAGIPGLPGPPSGEPDGGMGEGGGFAPGRPTGSVPV